VRRILLALLVVCVAPRAVAQIEVTGGASSLFNADGGTLFYRWPNATAFFGAGIDDARLVFGAGFEVRRRGCDWFAGDRPVYLATGQAGVAIALRGAEVSCATKTRQVVLFTGATGDATSTPFFAGVNANHFGAGALITERLGDLTLTGVAALDGSRKTLLAGADWRWRDVKLDATGGTIAGQNFFEGAGTFASSHVALAVTRADYLNVAAATSEGATVGVEHLSLFASAFQSTRSGQAAGANVTAGFLNAQVIATRSGTASLVSGNVTERLGPRFTVSQFVAEHNVGLGGSFTSNLVSASVGYQMMFSPTRGFAPVLTVSLRLQLDHGSANLAINRAAGQTYYTAYAGLYAGGPSLANASSHMAQ